MSSKFCQEPLDGWVYYHLKWRRLHLKTLMGGEVRLEIHLGHLSFRYPLANLSGNAKKGMSQEYVREVDLEMNLLRAAIINIPTAFLLHLKLKTKGQMILIPLLICTKHILT